MTMATK